MYELIITEKPKSALRIASALAESGVSKKSENGVPFYELEKGRKKIVVACAVGHLFGLGEIKDRVSKDAEKEYKKGKSKKVKTK